MRFFLALGLLAACSARLPPVAPPSSDAGPSPDAGAVLVFVKLQLDSAYRCEGVAVYDVNQDGVPDIVTDEYWYAGPNFVPNEIRDPEIYDAGTEYANGFGIYPEDVDGDGWLDIVVAPHPGDPMYWYKNPGGADVHWTPYLISAAGVAGVETPIVANLFGDGGFELIMTDSDAGILGWFTPAADPTQPWVEHAISPPGYAGAPVFTHGIGVSDVNGDGLLDVLTGYGWFQQTSDPDAWVQHLYDFGPNPSACSRMFAYDIDGDGLADVLCSRPHDYGLHWLHQQLPDGGGDPVFVPDNVIDDTISQMHALRLDDLDGDGIPEIISGKRFWAHGPGVDPGVNDPAILTYYTIQQGPNGPSFTRHEIDSNSGVGTQFAISDVDLDGKPDIVVSNKKGLFYFRQQ